jgi:hypothetical protein
MGIADEVVDPPVALADSCCNRVLPSSPFDQGVATMTKPVILLLPTTRSLRQGDRTRRMAGELGDARCGRGSVRYIDIEEQIGSVSLARVPSCSYTGV